MLTIHELKTLADIAGSALLVGMPVEAEKIFSSIIPFCPHPSNGPLIGLAMSLYAQGKIEEPISILSEKALATNPACADTNAHLALIYRAERRFAESQECIAIARQSVSEKELVILLDKIERGRFDG